MDRRQVLLAGVSGSVGLLPGCSSLFQQRPSQDPKPQLEVFVANALEHSIRVTITTVRGSTEFFDHTYTLDAGEGDESQSLVGTPKAITVSIRGGRTDTQEFSVPSSCTEPAVNVTIEPDRIMVTNGCVSS